MDNFHPMEMTVKKLALIASVAVLSTGCATHNFVLSNQAQATPSYDKMQTFFISGLGQEQEVNAAQVCNGADKVAKVQTQTTFLNGVLGNLSQGIYTPRQVRVYCK